MKIVDMRHLSTKSNGNKLPQHNYKVDGMDVVYLVRPGNQNLELRYSLRSLANILPGFRDVIVSGYKPVWMAKHVRCIPNNKRRGFAENTLTQIFNACKDPLVSDDFILMHDDFFIMKPTTIEWKHRGEYDKVINSYSNQIQQVNLYINRMKQTKKYLQSKGFKNPLCYERHVPVVINKKKFLKLESIPDLRSLNKLSLYGNLNYIGGTRGIDYKIVNSRTRWKKDSPFLSTDERTFTKLEVGAFIRKKFPRKSIYEQ